MTVSCRAFDLETRLGNKPARNRVNIPSMPEDRTLSIHVHKNDLSHIIEEYWQKGYVLKEKTFPTVIAQKGFIKLIFIPKEDWDGSEAIDRTLPKKKKRFFLGGFLNGG